MPAGRKVAVMMSGGVDSSVAAGLLLEQGWKVSGFTLLLYEGGPGQRRCCSLEAARGAQGVARVLGIEHRVLDYRELFGREVIVPYRDAYRAGKTPNPCVSCNERIKFGFFLEAAERAGAGVTATGHYARIGSAGGRRRLLKGIEPGNDQSYFLYRIRPELLGRIIFPLGGMAKERVRAEARRMGLPNAAARASQDACFTGGQGHAGFLAGRARPDRGPGPVRDLCGRELGRHPGIASCTVGQRSGLGVSGPRALFVVRIEAESNTVFVGGREDACRREFFVTETNWFISPPARAVRVSVRVRHGSREIPGKVSPVGPGRFRVELEEAQFAVAPGQSAVFYRGDGVLGGGLIES